MAPDTAEVVEETLLCRVELLCRLKIDPVLAGRGPEGTRPGPPTLFSMTELLIASAGLFPPVMPPSCFLIGN